MTCDIINLIFRAYFSVGTGLANRPAGPSSKTERKNMKKNIIKSLCGAAALLAAASTASAITTDAIRVSIDGGAHWTTVNDGDTTANGDFNSAPFKIIAAFNLGSGAFTVSVGGIGTGSGTASPFLDISVAGTMDAGTLIVQFSANGFAPVSGGGYVTTQTENGNNNALTETTFFGGGAGVNSLFDTTGGNLTPISLLPGPIGGTSSGPAPGGLTAPYSITIQDVFTSGGGGNLSADTTVKVPDGGNTLMLLGSALSVLGLGVFRNRKAVKA